MFYSKLFHVYLEKNFQFRKVNNTNLSIIETKILLYIRNPYEENSDIEHTINSLIKKNNLELNYLKTDYNLFEVLDELVDEVKESNLLFNLIDTHHYVNSLWSNGSLVFRNYTSHNETHSLHIIRTTNELLKIIEGVSLNAYEKYLVFMAAYLHDISLIIPPETGKIKIEKKDEHKFPEIKLISEEKENQTHLIHSLMLKYLDFLSEKLRDSHAIDSGDIIEFKEELQFIDKAQKGYISQISRLHVAEPDKLKFPKKFPGSHGVGHYDLDREKMAKVLRVADVLDITNQRVRKLFLEYNLNYMTDYSKYHWASHLITDHVEYSANTMFVEKVSESPLSETIDIIIYLNYKNNRLHNLMTDLDINVVDEENYKISIGEKKKSRVIKVPFSVKWFIKKNKYLFEELLIFKEMLNSKYKFSSTNFNIYIKYSEKTIKIKSELLNVVKKFVDK